MTDLRGLTVAQAIIIRLKIRNVYETRIKELKEIRERHVNRLIDPRTDLTRVSLLRSLIRDIDDSVANHEGMQAALLSEITVPE